MKRAERNTVTMATVAELEAGGFWQLADIARKYAVDRPRWWHRFTRRDKRLSHDRPDAICPTCGAAAELIDGKFEAHIKSPFITGRDER